MTRLRGQFDATVPASLLGRTGDDIDVTFETDETWELHVVEDMQFRYPEEHWVLTSCRVVGLLTEDGRYDGPLAALANWFDEHRDELEPVQL